MRTFAIERSTAEWSAIAFALESATDIRNDRSVQAMIADIRQTLRHDDNHLPGREQVELPSRARNAAHAEEVIRLAGEAAALLEAKQVFVKPASHGKLAARIRLVRGWMGLT